MIAILGDIFSGLIDIGKELIVDKDKQIEFSFKILEMQQQLAEKILTMNTTPKVDAFVKIVYAFKELIIPMFRPLGTFAITAFGVYAHIHNIQIPEYIHAGLDAAFGGWVYSRHVEKTKGSANTAPSSYTKYPSSIQS